MKQLLLLLLYVTLLPLQAATVYKWVDDDGQVHYSNKPAHRNAEEIRVRDVYIDSGTSKPDEATRQRIQKQKRFVEAMEAEQKVLSNERQQKKDEQDKRFLRCEAARSQLKRMQQASRLFQRDQQGKRVLLTDEQYNKAMQQARIRVMRWFQ